MTDSVNTTAIWILSGLDMFMTKHKNNPHLFCELFEKKKQILELMQSTKIDAKNYKKLVQKACKQANPELKKCAENDLLQLGNGQNDELVTNWFKMMVNSTGNFYEQQEKLYTSYQKTNIQTINQPQHPTVSQTKQQQSKPNFRIEQIISLKVADNMLETYEQNRDLYQKIYEQKQRILSKNLTADKYKTLLEMFQAKTTNEEFKMDVKLELQNIHDFHDGNVNAWYQEILQESKDNLKEQNKILANLKAGTKKSIVKVDKYSEQTLVQQKKSVLKSVQNINQIPSLKLLDDCLEECKTDLTRYKSILSKKKNLLLSQKKGTLTAKEYKKILQTCVKNTKNKQMRQDIQFQLSQIADFHDGNIQAWFQDVISTATLFLADQEEHLKKLEKGQIDIQPEEDISPSKGKVQETNQKPIEKTKDEPKVLLDFKYLYSLKALDEFMTKEEDNKQIYCLCFERKQAIFQMIKNREITPQKYKEYQETALKTTQNEQLKGIIEMDLVDLTQLCNNNINEWFKDLINQAGQIYQDQKAIYNKYKNAKSPTQSSSKTSQQKNQIISLTKIKITQKPLVNDVICITAIELLFTHAVETKDIVYYKDLSLKRQKLIDLISQKRLTIEKYRQINKAAGKTQNLFLKTIILEQQKRINTEFKNNDKEWFNALFKKLEVQPPEIVLPQNVEMKRLKYAPAHKKIEYLIRAMSIYQSLLYYYKKNKLPVEQNRYLVDYQKHKRKEAVHSFELIHLDKDFDVYNLAVQIFPEITTDIFYGDNLQKYKQRVAGYIQLLEKEIAALKEYSAGIKKSSNSQNIENSKKQTQKCKEHIAYLKTWPNGLTAFPLIKEQKVEKYNMDIFNKLDKNDFEISINSIEGLPNELVLNIYVIDMHKERHSSTVTNGAQTIKFTTRVTQKQMMEISKGNNTYIVIRFFKRGFFGGLSLLYQTPIQTIFTRSNIIDQKVEISNITIRYTLKVQRPTRPIIKQITHVDMTVIPKYKHQKFVEEELIKKYVMYSNPTQSEIMMIHPDEE